MVFPVVLSNPLLLFVIHIHGMTVQLKPEVCLYHTSLYHKGQRRDKERKRSYNSATRYAAERFSMQRVTTVYSLYIIKTTCESTCKSE